MPETEMKYLILPSLGFIREWKASRGQATESFRIIGARIIWRSLK